MKKATPYLITAGIALGVFFVLKIPTVRTWVAKIPFVGPILAS